MPSDMEVLVVGSVAYDTVRTPAGYRANALGGSGAYFSVAGSYFSPVSLVAVVGEDFAPVDMEVLRFHGVDVSGLETKPGKTFRWSGQYGAEDVNTRDTLDTQLNVFAEFAPRLGAVHRARDYLFLANIDPSLQLDVLVQMSGRPKLVALDTMNFWIDGNKDSLRRVVEKVDLLFMDEGEARSFSGEANLVAAAGSIMAMGPSAVVVKRGEHGVLLFQGDGTFAAPAFPLERVVDPTGAGDCFRGRVHGLPCGDGRPRSIRLPQGCNSWDSHGLLRRRELQSRSRRLADPGRHRRAFPGPDGHHYVHTAE